MSSMETLSVLVRAADTFWRVCDIPCKTDMNYVTGPREISINRPSAIRPIYEPPTQTTRSPWYAQVSNDVTKISLNSTRVHKVHKQRKKGWERGLGSRGESHV